MAETVSVICDALVSLALGAIGGVVVLIIGVVVACIVCALKNK